MSGEAIPIPQDSFATPNVCDVIWPGGWNLIREGEKKKKLGSKKGSRVETGVEGGDRKKGKKNFI